MPPKRRPDETSSATSRGSTTAEDGTRLPQAQRSPLQLPAASPGSVRKTINPLSENHAAAQSLKNNCLDPPLRVCSDARRTSFAPRFRAVNLSTGFAQGNAECVPIVTLRRVSRTGSSPEYVRGICTGRFTLGDPRSGNRRRTASTDKVHRFRKLIRRAMTSSAT